MTQSEKPARERRSRSKSSARVLVIYKKSAYQLMVRERKNERARALLER